MLRDKIVQLFEYRQLPMLMEAFQPNGQSDLYNSLIDLQTKIYNLDHYLEHNWLLSESKLSGYWNEIYTVLNSLGYTQQSAYDMCAHIRRYARHEMQLREGLFPLRLKLDYFYYYKSCDVRLIRHIIYDKSRLRNIGRKLADWRYFDLITEVNDDIDDLQEDVHTINANAFLISLITDGKMKTARRFKQLIGEAIRISESRAYRHSEKMNHLIVNKTRQCHADTLRLMTSQLDAIDVTDVKGSARLVGLLN